MQALVNAGGKGSRMGKCGIEKPMQMVGDKHTVQRVVEALSASSHIDRLLVSVSDNTPETERFLNSIGVETIRTSGESFMDDLHDAFKVMDGDYVLTCPSDLPLLTTEVVDTFLEYFVPGTMDSAIAVVDEETVLRTGITPSYTREDGGELGPVGALHNEPSYDPRWRVPGGVPVPDRLGRAVRQREHAPGAGAGEELLPR